MRAGRLKPVRVVVSLFFLLLTAFFFLDFTGSLAPGVVRAILFLQFLPSLVKILTLPGIAVSGVLVVVAATLLFGRVYCSSICPLGALQDVVTAVRRRLMKRSHRRLHHRFGRPHHAIRYILLLAALGSILAGQILLINLLDPFSGFGRIMVNLARPAVIVVNNGAAFLLERFQSYLVYRVPLNVLNVASVASAVAILGAVVWLASAHGRLYCNTICPVGTFLGLLSRAALFKVRVVADDCINCTLCERVCKGACIDSKMLTVDMSRCVACFNCFDACPTRGLTYTWRRNPEGTGAAVTVDGRRRRLLLLASAALTGWSAGRAQGRTPEPSKPSTVPIVRAIPVSPPGSGGIDRFTASCTACHACISVCPTGVLVPSFAEYGFEGILQPTMNYVSGFCNFDCTLCSEVCPSGALVPLAVEAKRLVQVGVAKFVKDNCIVYAENTECGACSEHCPTKAVVMTAYKSLRAPEIKEEYCIGCGACEHACPTKPYKAIYVEGNRVHVPAKKKEEKKLEEAPPGERDFPF